MMTIPSLILLGLALAWLALLLRTATTLTGLTETITLTGSNGSYTGVVNAAGGTPTGSLLLGQGSWAAMTQAFTFGTGNNQVNQVYIAQRAVATVTLDPIDLSGSLISPVGDTIAFTKIKFCAISIVAPDGTKKLRVGPQAVTNPFIGPWSGGQGATVYKELTNFEIVVFEPIAGYTVTASTGDIFQIYNPTAVTVTYNIIFLGLG